MLSFFQNGYYIRTNKVFVLYSFGGAEEPRTPVRKHPTIDIYKFSQLVNVLKKLVVDNSFLVIF